MNDSADFKSYSISKNIFLRCLGVIYGIAFVSLWLQIDGLIGSNGISPCAEFLIAARKQLGFQCYWSLPTVFWFSASDFALHAVCAVGTFFSIALAFGFSFGLNQVLLWILYLSLATVSREFLGFQWDNLLLEAGFLSIFIVPFSIRFWSKLKLQTADSCPLGILAFQLLLFKLMFLSGWVKLSSGDPNWRDLTALAVHYETQPLPTWIGWYAHQLPQWAQRISVLIVFLIELVIPFFIFLVRPFRLTACGILIVFQILILLTGNYCFFNYLTIALCLFLVDDKAWKSCVPFLQPREITEHQIKLQMYEEGLIGRILFLFNGAASVILLSILLAISAGQILETVHAPTFIFSPVKKFERFIYPFRIVNRYGLFAVMTTHRFEIVVEGSQNGVDWLPYEFKWKPQGEKKKPAFVAPYQPRLDWQMWFAALSNYKNNPWFVRFLKRLLEGSQPVLDLLARNPFPDHPPRFIRAVFYEYRFTDLSTQQREGKWWKSERKGLYIPTLSLSEKLS